MVYTVNACSTTLQYRVLEYRFLQAWCPEAHAHYPPRFKAAARALLLAAKRVPEREDECGLWSAPAEVLLHVLTRSAEDLEAWFEEHYSVENERQRLIISDDTPIDDFSPTP